MKSIIHVHQQLMKQGKPAIIVRTYKGSKYYSKVIIEGPSIIIHSAKADSCGARIWIETQAEIKGE